MQDPSPLLKGPGLAGSHWLLTPLGTHLPLPLSLSPTQTGSQDRLIHSPTLAPFSKIPHIDGPAPVQKTMGTTERQQSPS